MDGGSWHCAGDTDQNHPKEKEMQKAKWLSEEALQIAEERREAKSKGKGKRYIQLNAELQRKARRDKKVSSIVLISHANKVMLKILQARLQHYMNQELPDVQAGL